MKYTDGRPLCSVAPLTPFTHLNEDETGMWKRFPSMTSFYYALYPKEKRCYREHEWKKKGVSVGGQKNVAHSIGGRDMASATNSVRSVRQ